MGMDRDFSSTHEAGGADYRSPDVASYSSSPNGITLHFGVIDIPYVHQPSKQKIPQAKKGKAVKPVKAKVESGTQTTGDVAGWLEKKYGVMQTFYDMQMPAIAAEMEESLAGALENLMMGAPPGNGPFESAASHITQMFKTFLAEGEIEHAGIEGVPTEAALKGVNHRLKTNRGATRPSFIDSGLYQQSFIAWID